MSHLTPQCSGRAASASPTRALCGRPAADFRRLDAMNSEDLNVIGILALVIGFYILLARGFLRFGAMLRRRYPRATGSRLPATIHVLALFAFLIGCLLAWMAYDSDNPTKERQLLLPVVLPLCVYGFVFLHIAKEVWLWCSRQDSFDAVFAPRGLIWPSNPRLERAVKRGWLCAAGGWGQ